MSSKSLQASAVWRVFEVLGGEVSAFVVFAILTHMLVPEHFGAVALATAIVLVLQVFVYSGALDSLTQLPKLEARHFRAATAANLAVGVALVVVGSLLAWPLSLVLNRDGFFFILVAMLPMLLVRAVMTPMLAAIRRDMDFKTIAIRTLLATTTGGAVAVALALSGAGVWALVAQQWTSELVGALMLVRRSPYKPWTLRWDRRSLDELLPVAVPVTSAGLAIAATRRLDILAIGFRLGDALVGVYFMVSRLIFAIQMLTQYGLGEVAMVVMCKLRPRIEQPWLAISAVFRLAAWPAFMLFGLMALVGPAIVPLVFGPDWEPASAPMALYSAFSPAGVVVGLVGVALISAGNADAFQKMSIAIAGTQIAAVFVAAAWGLVAVIVAIGVTQLLSLPFALAYLRRTEGITWDDTLGRIGPLIVAYIGCFTPCAALLVWSDDWRWLAGVIFIVACSAVGFLMLRKDWATVTQALARARSEGGEAMSAAG